MPPSGSVHATVQPIDASGGRTFSSHESSAGSAVARGVAPEGAVDAGLEVEPDPVRERDPARRRPDDVGLGRKLALRVRVEGRGDPVEVPLHGLMDALRQREIGDRVVEVEQPPHLGVDRGRLGRVCRR